MRILLDHMVPHELRYHLNGDIFTTQYMGWEEFQNGDLLEAVSGADFDVLVTHDKSMRYQQNMPRYAFAVVQLDAASNDSKDIFPLVPRINKALKTISPGDFVVVG